MTTRRGPTEAEGRRNPMQVATAEIYALKDPGTGEIRYIGKANDSAKRFKSHIRDSRHRNTPVYCWIRKLISQNSLPLMEVLETTEDWKSAEIRLIAEYRKTHRLLNVADGGDEPACSKEQRAINGRTNARAIHDDPFRKKIWKLNRDMASDLKWMKDHGRRESYNRIAAELKTAAAKCPDLFGRWSTLVEI